MVAITVRLDDDQHEKLVLYRAFTGRAANDLITGLVREFFECQGDTEIAEAMTERAKRNFGSALDELRDR
jgi:hypothetical protein